MSNEVSVADHYLDLHSYGILTVFNNVSCFFFFKSEETKERMIIWAQYFY
jgi:hypothetical protein